MAPKLPPIAVRAVVKGFIPFQKMLDQVNKKIEEVSKKTQAAAKSAPGLFKELNKVGLSYYCVHTG